MDIQYVSRGEHEVPTRGSAGAAGWDLYAAENCCLKPFVPTLCPTNIDIAVPAGHMLWVLPRSGNSLKKQIIVPNSPGLVDEDYRGHLQVILSWIPNVNEVWNWAGAPIMTPVLIVKKGERIAQVVLMPYVEQVWSRKDELPPSARGAAGFGSTGQ